MSKQITSYEVSNEELVTRLMRAACQAGTSTSGLCFDIAAGVHVANMHYYKGVVLARLAGKKPPYEPGVRVVVCKRDVYEKSGRGPSLPSEREYVVKRVWYADGDWYLELNGIDGDSNFQIYQSAAFRSVNVEDTPAVAA